MKITERKIRLLIKQALLKEAEEKGPPTSKERMLKFANGIAEKLKLPQIGATEKDRTRWKELITAIEEGDLKKANSLFSKEGYGEIWNSWDDPIIKLKIRRLKQGIRSVANSGKKGGGSGEKKTKKKPLYVVKEIQKELNILGFTDYQGKELSEDGLWGTRTRTAASKFLIDFAKDVEEINRSTEKRFRAPSMEDAAESGKDFYNFLSIDNDMIKKLSTKPGKVGSWKKVALHALIDTEKFLNNSETTGAVGLLTQTDGMGNSVKNAPEDLKHYQYLLFILDEYEKFKDDQEEGEGEGEGKEESKQRIEKSRQELVNNILTRVKDAPVLRNWKDRVNDYIYIHKKPLIKSRYLYNGIKSSLETIKPIHKADRESALIQNIVYLDTKDNKTKPIGEKVKNHIIDKTQDGFSMVFFRMKFQGKTKYFVIPAK